MTRENDNSATLDERLACVKKKRKRSGYTERPRTGRTPTSSTSEQKVPHAGMPWETGSGEGKYSYYPGGDRNAEPKEAPSAVNVVVVPDVNLPKVRSFPDCDEGALTLEQGILARSANGGCIANVDSRSCTRSTTSGARTDTKRLSNYPGDGRHRGAQAFPGSCVDRMVTLKTNSLQALFRLSSLS